MRFWRNISWFPFGRGGRFPFGQNSQSGYLLNQVSVNAWAACSLRRLRTAYTGPAIRVLRSSDSAESDIRFVGGDLDTSSLIAFVGSGTGYVKKMYDQSGNGRDFVQTGLTTFMPRIIITGTLQTVNGLPAVFYGLTAGQGLSYDNTTNADFKDSVVSGVARFASDAGNNARIIAGRNSADANDYDANSAIFAYRPATAQQISTYFNANQSTATWAYSTLKTFRTVADSGKGTQLMSVDGTDAGPQTSNAPQLRFFCTGDILGSGSPFKGYINEFVLWNSVLSQTDLSALRSNQRAYWRTP